MRWLVNENIDTIITTDETVFEQITNSFPFEIKNYDSICECISNCDSVFIFNDCLKNEVTNRIKYLSAAQNKRCFEINCSEQKKMSNSHFNPTKPICNASNELPTIAIFSLGQATVSIKTELDINYIFTNAGVAINQFL